MASGSARKGSWNVAWEPLPAVGQKRVEIRPRETTRARATACWSSIGVVAGSMLAEPLYRLVGYEVTDAGAGEQAVVLEDPGGSRADVLSS